MEINLPVLFINFKTYLEATAEKALELAKVAEKAAVNSEKSIVVVAQPTDLKTISSAVSIPVFAQHIDAINPGSNTGHILPEAVKSAGAKGTVLNHAERKLDNELLKQSIARAKETGLLVLACAESVERAKQIAGFSVRPDFIAFEPPELIGGDISVSTAQPEVIKKAIEAIADTGIPLLVGAGIKSMADTKKSIELKAAGVFVASGVIKADSPEQAMLDLVNGF